MACLSWKLEHTKGFVVVANPIFPVSEPGALPGGAIDFEVLEANADLLREHIGAVNVFYIDDDTGVFTAKLGPLVRVMSTHPALALLREEPTLRGRLEFVEAEPLGDHGG